VRFIESSHRAGEINKITHSACVGDRQQLGEAAAAAATAADPPKQHSCRQHRDHHRQLLEASINALAQRSFDTRRSRSEDRFLLTERLQQHRYNLAGKQLLVFTTI